MEGTSGGKNQAKQVKNRRRVSTVYIYKPKLLNFFTVYGPPSYVCMV